MQKKCSIRINGEKFSAKSGEILLDAALVNGVEIPHDCRSGHCGTCQVSILKGFTISDDGIGSGMVRACQARVVTDLEVLVEPAPDVVISKGEVAGVRPLASDIVELRIRPAEPLNYLPGQYYKLQFRNFPARCYSPTVPMTRPYDKQAMRFHIRQVPDGLVSSAIGRKIFNGHKLTIEGPYGNAYLRPGKSNRLILVSSGTGFAPIWSIAAAAMKEDPARRIVLIASVREVESLYMVPAFRRLGMAPNVEIIPVVSSVPEYEARTIRQGRPTDHMPALQPSDIVYACGGPGMVEAIREKTSAAGAAFYADPFVSQSAERTQGLVSWALEQFTGKRSQQSNGLSGMAGNN